MNKTTGFDMWHLVGAFFSLLRPIDPTAMQMTRFLFFFLLFVAENHNRCVSRKQSETCFAASVD